MYWLSGFYTIFRKILLFCFLVFCFVFGYTFGILAYIIFNVFSLIDYCVHEFEKSANWAIKKIKNL